MKKVEVLSVGTELLMGMVANTNAQYISKRLPEIGYGVYYHSVVGDNPQRLKESLALALSRSDVVIMTGGLGPTQDDLTKETVAEAFGLELVPDEESIENIKNYFKNKGAAMVESNFKQGYFPRGSVIMKNGMGTAPGCIIEQKGKTVFMLPGPPKELIPMFDDSVMPYLREREDMFMKSIFLRSVGVGESMVEKIIMPLVDGQTNPTIATYVKDGVVTIRITASGKTDEEAACLADNYANEAKKLLGESVFTDKEEEMWETVFKMLDDKGLTMAAAESCTGGLVASKITSVPGASRVFKECAVTYTNEAKIAELRVSKKTLERCGAVSRETAIEMVRGIFERSGADVCVSVTGLAGPDGGEGKPAGLVYIAAKYREREEVGEYNFRGDRERVRTLATLNAYDMIRKIISK